MKGKKSPLDKQTNIRKKRDTKRENRLTVNTEAVLCNAALSSSTKDGKKRSVKLFYHSHILKQAYKWFVRASATINSNGKI